MPAQRASLWSLPCDGMEHPSPSRLDLRRLGGGLPGTSLGLGRLAAVDRGREPEQRRPLQDTVAVVGPVPGEPGQDGRGAALL